MINVDLTHGPHAHFQLKSGYPIAPHHVIELSAYSTSASVQGLTEKLTINKFLRSQGQTPSLPAQTEPNVAPFLALQRHFSPINGGKLSQAVYTIYFRLPPEGTQQTRINELKQEAERRIFEMLQAFKTGHPGLVRLCEGAAFFEAEYAKALSLPLPKDNQPTPAVIALTKPASGGAVVTLPTRPPVGRTETPMTEGQGAVIIPLFRPRI